MIKYSFKPSKLKADVNNMLLITSEWFKIKTSKQKNKATFSTSPSPLIFPGDLKTTQVTLDYGGQEGWKEETTDGSVPHS